MPICAVEDIPTITKIQYESHTFLRFGDISIVHDPECRCSLRFKGFLKMNDKYYNIILFTDYVSDHE